MTKKTTLDFISLHFSGVKLNPEKITDYLGVKPISSGFANEDIKGPSGKRLTRKMGSWVFGFEESVDINEQLAYLTNYFSGKEKELREIASWDSVEHAYIDVVINPEPDYGTHSVLLNGKDVGFWGSIGIDICCTFWNPLIFEKE